MQEEEKRKYFLIRRDMDLEKTPLRVWVNEKLLRKDFPADHKLPFFGLKFPEPPRIRFDRKGRTRPLRDADDILLGIWLVSDRLKSLLERMDAEAFAFVRAEVDYSNFDEPGPGYWFCDFVRFLDCVDEGRSKIIYQKDISWKNYINLVRVEMKPEIVGDARAFRLTYSPLREVVDDVLVGAMTTTGITGFEFVPLQED
ncbi:MAG: DUF1629 domain-containing protein [Parvibaculum sp.]|uniref:imm11 family protein n=1 Tax=Parvibaculum sp. TaxID=2024848 RepID=UPI002AB917CD|nr:DUF1629 domain-containing protein [Parvibaculum sp.]MDZ4379979.1 DUF1629 domain-containing protein [Parvibaculum sp.]